MLGYNLFAYCENNPAMFVDPNGDFPGIIAIGTFLYYAAVALVQSITITVGLVCTFKIAVDVGELISDHIEDLNDNTEEAPKSITEPSDDTTNNEKENSLPKEWEPNSDRELYDKDGLKQRRHYGPDGKAEYDIDFHHAGKNHKFPHKHYWDWTKTPPRLPGVND